MPHGDFSDKAAFACAGTGLVSIFMPSVWFTAAGPLKPMLDVPATPELLGVIRFAGGLLMFMFPVLFVVRWNVINGKAAALGMWIATAATVYTALSLDGFAFVLRGWYIFAALFLLAGVHLAFNANPMLTSAMLKEKEDAKAAKAKAK